MYTIIMITFEELRLVFWNKISWKQSKILVPLSYTYGIKWIIFPSGIHIPTVLQAAFLLPSNSYIFSSIIKQSHFHFFLTPFPKHGITHECNPYLEVEILSGSKSRAVLVFLLSSYTVINRFWRVANNAGEE